MPITGYQHGSRLPIA